jgi:HEPN domain-containing protein
MFENLPEQVNSLNRKAITALKQGQYELGIQFAQQACELGKYAFGENNHNYANLINTLALLYREMRRFTDAEPFTCKQRRFAKPSWEKIIPTMPPV